MSLNKENETDSEYTKTKSRKDLVQQILSKIKDEDITDSTASFVGNSLLYFSFFGRSHWDNFLYSFLAPVIHLLDWDNSFYASQETTLVVFRDYHF